LILVLDLAEEPRDVRSKSLALLFLTHSTLFFLLLFTELLQFFGLPGPLSLLFLLFSFFLPLFFLLVEL
jgi:hypothetical protein